MSALGTQSSGYLTVKPYVGSVYSLYAHVGSKTGGAFPVGGGGGGGVGGSGGVTGGVTGAVTGGVTGGVVVGAQAANARPRTSSTPISTVTILFVIFPPLINLLARDIHYPVCLLKYYQPANNLASPVKTPGLIKPGVSRNC